MLLRKVVPMCLQIYELAQEIAEWLSDDTQSLYSLCLVNRACFFSAARLLWKTPFCVGKVSSKSHLKVIRESLLFANYDTVKLQCDNNKKTNFVYDHAKNKPDFVYNETKN